MEEFFARLKQHKLVQWALAYVAVSFGLIPVTDVIAQQFGWPEAVRRGVIIALATGFFITLVLAWYHGERGHGQIIRSELGILSVLMALGLVAIWRIAPTTPVPVVGKALAPPADAAPAAVIPQKSVAVLPLINGSGNQDEQYFSDGLSEDLITALSQFAGLKVISRDSAFQFRHSIDSSKVIGEKLGVAHLLEGSVRRAGDEVRISAELVNAANGSTLWSEHYDRPYKDLFKLQDDITKAVADALKAKLLSSPSAVVQSDRPPSGNLDAYNAYLQGNAYFATGTAGSFHQAIAAYTTATRLDPHYARAFAALSYVQTNLANAVLSGAEQRQAYAQARSAADTALALDPNSAAAHSARGNLLKYADFDLTGAEAAYRHALQLAPNDAQTKYFLGGLLAELGQTESAVELTQQALASDPRHASWYLWLSQYLGALGRLDEAEHAVRTAIALQPGAADLHEQLTIVEILRGDAKAALAAAQQEVAADGWREIALTLAQQISGDPAVADTALKHLIDHQADGSAYQIAQVYALRRDPDHMFQWLDRAWASRDPGIAYLLYDPFILRYKDDPRFAALCKKVGLPVPGAIDAIAAPP